MSMMQKIWFRRRTCALLDSLAPFTAWMAAPGCSRLCATPVIPGFIKIEAHEMTTMFDEEIHSVDSDSSNPAALVLRSADHQILRQALDELPVEFREVVVLRDLEGFSYKEIADITNIPAGTVMSRLARARERLKQLVCNPSKGEAAEMDCKNAQTLNSRLPGSRVGPGANVGD